MFYLVVYTGYKWFSASLLLIAVNFSVCLILWTISCCLIILESERHLAFACFRLSAATPRVWCARQAHAFDWHFFIAFLIYHALTGRWHFHAVSVATSPIYILGEGRDFSPASFLVFNLLSPASDMTRTTHVDPQSSVTFTWSQANRWTAHVYSGKILFHIEHNFPPKFFSWISSLHW